jgi:hypothetical protein
LVFLKSFYKINLFSISSFNIWFFNRSLCFFSPSFLWGWWDNLGWLKKNKIQCYLKKNIFFNFITQHLLFFCFGDFLGLAFTRPVQTSWPWSRVSKVLTGWLWSSFSLFLNIFFQFHSLTFNCLGIDLHVFFFHFTFSGVSHSCVHGRGVSGLTQIFFYFIIQYWVAW